MTTRSFLQTCRLKISANSYVLIYRYIASFPKFGARRFYTAITGDVVEVAMVVYLKNKKTERG